MFNFIFIRKVKQLDAKPVYKKENFQSTVPPGSINKDLFPLQALAEVFFVCFIDVFSSLSA